MAVRKLQVFLASRFEEFHDLRLALKKQLDRLKVPPVEAVDLNDNAADPNPPLGRCYEAVDNAELFVLLVGDTYGASPKGHKESYTHLEYRRALNDGSKTILPFLIGHSHDRKFESRQLSDRGLADWVTEIRDNHTPSYLDVSLGADQLASTIFNEVLARLVELFADVDDREFEETGDETEVIYEDSPIKREQLANSPKLSADKASSEQPLKMLAANHAKEALLAFDLGLPQVAIHHLQRAADLVPLDIILGYWLARLLIATGRRKECLEGRRIALRCAWVAAGKDNNLELETMASYVLAARASDRLGELDVAKEYGRLAHEEMPHHWMAKLEYGRQLASAGEEKRALELAEEAFWLRPDSIRQIQRDAVYRGLGEDFDRFRAKLRRTVNEETGEITRIEVQIREFALRLGVNGIISPTILRTSISSDGKNTIGQLLQHGRVSMKSSLQALQQCAATISVEANSFMFGADKGLTPAIKTRIREAIQTLNTEVNNLNYQQDEARNKVKQSQEQRSSILVASCLAAVFLIAIAAMAMYAGATGLAVILILIIAFSALAVTYSLQSVQETISSEAEVTRTIGNKIEAVKRSLTEMNAVMQRFEAQQSRLGENVRSFCNLVDQFEIRGLRRLTFSPAPPVDRKGKEDIVRTDEAKVTSMGLGFDDELLPTQLRFVLVSSKPKSKNWLARRVRAGTTETLSRSAAYFR